MEETPKINTEPDPKKNKYTLMIYGLGVIAIVIVGVIISWFGGEIFPHTNEAISVVGIEVETTKIISPDAPVGIVFFDLDGGDSTLIISGGEVCLINGGRRENAPKIINYIQALGYKRIKYLIATHVESDTIGGLGTIASNFYIDNVLLPAYAKTSDGGYLYRSFLDDLRSTGAEITNARAGFEFSLGEAVCDVVAPVLEGDGDAVNSTVIRLKYGKCSAIFLAAASAEEESYLTDMGSDLTADILKIGNRGISTGNTEGFIQQLHPSVAVISTAGSDTDYPSDSVIMALLEQDTAIYRTDYYGDITVRIYPEFSEILTGENR
ncbi:MAG: hypothetical protein K6G90_13850 [Clostridia bacterium]|nr:hypothetical protein [Clostridia bacterium]